MSRLPNQKLKLIYLSRILEERTDAYHALTLTEISSALGEYGISAERKSLYDDIEALRLCGYDIQVTRDTHVRYYLATHKFEPAELRLLTDAVQSSRFLTPKKSRELIKKIGELGSKYEAGQISRQNHSANRIKTENEEIYNNIVTIQGAIAENKKIRCHYFEWNANKQRILRKNGDEYIISPWALSWDDEYYYLVAYDSDACKIKHFRVDKMIRVRVMDEPRDGAEPFKDFDMAIYSQRVFNMYGGEPTNVRILTDNSLAGVVIDRFGAGVTVLNRGDKFEFCAKVMISPTFYSWVLGFGNKMKILSPQNVADEAARLASEVVSVYDDSDKE